MPLQKDNIQETSHKPPRIRRSGTQALERPASDLTCNEADVDELLSEGELT